MAFDRTNPADLLALKTEVNSDPVTMGYNPSGGTDTLLDLLNNPVSNTVPESGPDVVTARRLLKAIYPESISSQDQFKLQLLFEAGEGMESDLSEFKAEISSLSAGIATAVGTIQRDLSRAEVLFSVLDENGVREKVTISKQDWVAARDS